MFYMTEGWIILGAVMKVRREDGRGGMSHAPGELINTYSYPPSFISVQRWGAAGLVN